jgi:predicted dehydrogenase
MIGCGDVAEVKSGPGFYKADHSSLVAVMRRNGALAADYARRHSVARWSDDAESVIQAADIDAVYIATLTDSHRDYTLRCARAGKPVYVEKPMAMRHAECVEMIEACRDAGVPLWVGYYRRALPRFLKVRDLVESGAIGQVRMVISRQFARAPKIADGDALPWRIDPAKRRRFLLRGGLPHVRFSGFRVRPDRRGARCRVQPVRRLSCRGYCRGGIPIPVRRQGCGVWCYAAGEDYEMNEIVGERGRLLFSLRSRRRSAYP